MAARRRGGGVETRSIQGGSTLAGGLRAFGEGSAEARSRALFRGPRQCGRGTQYIAAAAARRRQRSGGAVCLKLSLSRRRRRSRATSAPRSR